MIFRNYNNDNRSNINAENNGIEGGYNITYLSPETTKAKKGICAVLIMIHHLSQNCANLPLYLSILGYIGFILVSIFFFSSGYGLMSGISSKENYLDNFLFRRLSAILVPYYFINSIYIIYDFVKGNSNSNLDYILSIFGVDTITGTWFVTSILICYLAFFIIFKYFSIDNSLRVMHLFVLCYIVICMLLDLHTSRYASIVAFDFGLVWKIKEKDIDNFLKNKYNLKLFTVLMSFSLLFISRLIISYFGFNNEILHTILRNIISLLFVISTILISMSVEFVNRVTLFLGTISYELYIIHQFWIKSLREFYTSNIQFVVSVVCISIFTAFILSKVDNLVIKKVQKITKCSVGHTSRVLS